MSTIPPSKFDEAFRYPKIRKVIKTDLDNPDHEHNVFWNAKFYPYDTEHGADPIFALANRSSVLICRISGSEDKDKDHEVNVLRSLSVASGETFTDDYISISWAFLDQGEPLLLGAGESGLIRVFDVVKGELKTTLIGHGQSSINDLATHPIYPWIVASASEDTSVRVWDLRRYNNTHETPCVVICGHGHGHRESVLSVSWHDNGRYLITGAHDHRICIWTVPDLSPDSSFWEEISPSQRRRSSGEVRIIHYPHFTTSAVHGNYVDCVQFYGDTVFSKAAEEHKIVWWSITGFNSKAPPPDPILAPKTEEHLDTRNGFTRSYTISDSGVHNLTTQEVYKNRLPYTRLLEFHADHCTPFFIRFSLLKPSAKHPDVHPMLAIGNVTSKVFFWNLHALEIGDDFQPPKKRQTKAKTKKGIAQRVDKHRAGTSSTPLTEIRGSSANSAAPSPSRSSSILPDNSTDVTPQSEFLLARTVTNGFGPPRQPLQPSAGTDADRERFPLHNPHTPLTQAHKVVPLDAEFHGQGHLAARSVAWSADGKWCVVAGETAVKVAGEAGPRQIGAAVVLGRWTGDGRKREG